MIVTAVACLLLSACSITLVRSRVAAHRRPSKVDYWAPTADSVVAISAVIGTVLLARAEADDPIECTGPGFLGGERHCDSTRYTGAIDAGMVALAATVSAIYGWVWIPSLRDANVSNGCEEDSDFAREVVGCPPPTWARVRDAIAAARAGDCATVKAIAIELRARHGGTIVDPDFLNDRAIQVCLLGPGV